MIDRMKHFIFVYKEKALELSHFLPLTIKSLYEILVEMNLYCDLQHLKLQRRLCLQDYSFVQRIGIINMH